MADTNPRPVEGRLLHTIDCTRDNLTPDEYFGYGNVKVVESPIGTYREAQGRPLSRFGYRFHIENVGRPHMLVVRYPDDKRRFMFVMDGTCYDNSTGIVTGFAQPLTGGMQELVQVFWPRWHDCSITFMTVTDDEPAAVETIRIYELDDLPALEVPGDPLDGSRREIGIQYEDPCGTGISEGASSHEEWTERVIDYARHTGQRLFCYPINWYHGPWFPSEREPSDMFDCVVGQDRKQYIRWTSNPPDWVAAMLDRFDDEGLEFQGVLTLLRLGSLMQKMNTDLDAIKAGADTINNMLWCDRVQEGTMDWTPTYNVRNYPMLLDSHAGKIPQSEIRWAYGEKHGQPYHPNPIFNPLHPIVQEALIGYASEIAQRYGGHRSFKGITITMWAPTLLWFGSIHAGYDDYTIGLFERETGVEVPVDKTLPDRFSRRYEFLTYGCRPLWVAWRCKKIRELICKIRDAMVAVRPDLRVTLNLWSEPYVLHLMGHGGVQQQLHARPGIVELAKDAGIDVALFRDDANIEFDIELDGGSRDRTPWGTDKSGVERLTMFRDHDLLDMRSLDAIGAQKRPGAFIFNAWHEVWGNHKWFPCDPDDEQAHDLAFILGKPVDGIFRMNSTYPADGFWWDSQLRITSAYPPSPHFMEQHAHALAELDACRITRGGLFLDKAHGEEIRRFAKAFRALPREKFQTVGATTDPVAVRTLIHDGRRYIYLVNRDYYPVVVELSFDRSPDRITDLASGGAIPATERWNLTLGAYELRSVAVGPEVEVAGFTAVAPREVAEALARETDTVLAAFEKVRALGRILPGMDEMEAGIRSALSEGRLAWLRRALTSYAARKSLELAKA